MIVKSTKLGGALALLICLGTAARAQGVPEAGPERTDEESSVRKDEAVAPARTAPQLLLRLEQLEAARRQNRAQALADPKAWAASRAQRAAQHRLEILQVWGNVVNSIDGQANLRIHAQRMARLNRMLDLAEHAADQALSARIRADIQRELVRHAKSMETTLVASGAR